VTQDIKKAAAALGVVLHDHLIIGRNGHISLRELGEIWRAIFHGMPDRQKCNWMRIQVDLYSSPPSATRRGLLRVNGLRAADRESYRNKAEASEAITSQAVAHSPSDIRITTPKDAPSDQ